MGTGRQLDVPPKLVRPDLLKRIPHAKPPFTMSQLKKAIPQHCFQRSILRSFSYLFYDLSAIYTLYHVATVIIPALPAPLRYLAWLFYGGLQGCVMGGVWVLAHECGHHAFSDCRRLDDTIGFVLHSALLVPYFSLKYQHARHHASVGSMEREEVIVPRMKQKQRAEVQWFFEFLRKPPNRISFILVSLIFGWPLFLSCYITGRTYDRFACLFDPWSPVFPERKQLQIIASNFGLAAVLYILYHSAVAHGSAWVVCIYGGPLLVMNGLVVANTFLQHVHPALPHFDSSEWDWLRGTLCTVDRDWGILNHVFHNITDTHLLHHLFSKIPHYHAKEATFAIKPELGEYYRFDDTPIIKAIYREVKCMCYVERDTSDNGKGVFWYDYGS